MRRNSSVKHFLASCKHGTPQRPQQTHTRPPMPPTSPHASRSPVRYAPADEQVQIVHKLLLDLLNAALRNEAVRLHSSRAPRVGGGAVHAALPSGAWHELPADDYALQRMVDGAVQQTIAWLMQSGQVSEEMPIEVQLSCMLEQDAEDIERGWREGALHKEGLIADTADALLGGLLSECAAEMDGEQHEGEA